MPFCQSPARWATLFPRFFCSQNPKKLRVQNRYYVHPQTPISRKHLQKKLENHCKHVSLQSPMKYASVICLLMLVSRVSFAQSASGLQLDTLVVKLHDAINIQKSIEIEEIKGVYRITPWHFLPNLNYDFINNNYYVTISSGPIISNMINKRHEVRRLSAADRKYDNRTRAAEIRLKSLFISINQSLANLHLSFEIVSNDIEIFIIKHTEHINHEIDTETYLQARSSILNKIRSHNSDVAAIQRQLLEIELLTETEILLDLTAYLISPASIVPQVPIVP